MPGYSGDIPGKYSGSIPAGWLAGWIFGLFPPGECRILGIFRQESRKYRKYL